MPPLNNPNISWKCPDCEEHFPATPKHWYYDKARDRYMRPCKTCYKARVTARRQGLRQVRRREKATKIPLGGIHEDMLIAAWARKLHMTLRARNRRKFPSCQTISALDLAAMHTSQEGCCYYTGLTYQMAAPTNSFRTQPPLTVSVDRVDSTKGYELGNVVLCCWFVNCAKNAWPLDVIQPLWAHLPTG